MKNVLVVLAAMIFISLIVDVADARPRRRRYRRYNYNYSNYTYVNQNWGSSPAEVADAKARYLANNQYMAHVGGGYGGANAEGVGASSYSAAAALGNCCFTGQRPLAASACYQGANGVWYAVKLFW